MRPARRPAAADPAAGILRRGPVTPAAGVVAGWAAINAVLVAVLAGFAGLSVPLLIYSCATLVVVGIAFVILANERRRRRPPPVRLRPYADAVPLFGAAAGVGGLGLAFGWWLAPIAGVLLVLATVAAAVARKDSP